MPLKSNAIPEVLRKVRGIWFESRIILCQNNLLDFLHAFALIKTRLLRNLYLYIYIFFLAEQQLKEMLYSLKDFSVRRNFVSIGNAVQEGLLF